LSWPVQSVVPIQKAFAMLCMCFVYEWIRDKKWLVYFLRSASKACYWFFIYLPPTSRCIYFSNLSCRDILTRHLFVGYLQDWSARNFSLETELLTSRRLYINDTINSCRWNDGDVRLRSDDSRNTKNQSAFTQIVAIVFAIFIAFQPRDDRIWIRAWTTAFVCFEKYLFSRERQCEREVPPASESSRGFSAIGTSCDGDERMKSVERLLSPTLEETCSARRHSLARIIQKIPSYRTCDGAPLWIDAGISWWWSRIIFDRKNKLILSR